MTRQPDFKPTAKNWTARTMVSNYQALREEYMLLYNSIVSIKN
jgi:hypothetical protein